MAVLKAVNAGLFDDLPLDKVGDAETAVQRRVLDELPELCQRMEAGEKLQDVQWQQLLDVVGKALSDITEREHP